MPPSPPTFTTLKSRILTSLSAPTHSYTDASPKGSLDTALVPLIARLNALDGVVTTSSCAGRVSVFLEGRKGGWGEEVEGVRRRGGVDGETDGKGEGSEEAVVELEERSMERKWKGKKGKKMKSVPGGKGLGGRWLYVSHDPVQVPEGSEGGGEEPLTRMFGLTRRREGSGGVDRSVRNARYVKFAFEPMILHVATASLTHAAPILSAAISAGFRESGVQSLKNLSDPNALPMVAVRSAGLALESIIGVAHEPPSSPDASPEGQAGQDRQDEVIEALVEEPYLEMLVDLANERFTANTERIRRFEDALFGARSKRQDDWEGRDARQERKRREGLQRKEALEADRNGSGTSVGVVDENQDVFVGDFDGDQMAA